MIRDLTPSCATFGHVIDVIAPDGSASQIPVHSPQDITEDDRGNLYIAGTKTNSHLNGIYFYDGKSQPYRITADASGQARPSEGVDISSVFFETRAIQYSTFHGGLLIPYNGKIWLMRDGVDERDGVCYPVLNVLS